MSNTPIESPRPALDVPPSQVSQDDLRSSESRYRRLFEAAQDGILLLNADTAQIEDVNPYLVTLLGYSHAEFLGKKLWEVGAFADVAQSRDMFAVLQTQGYVRYEDMPLKTRTGVKIAVEFVSNSYICDGIKVIQCNIRDITARRNAENALVESESRTRRLLRAANIGLWDWNLATDAVYFSPEWKRQLGFTDDEISNRMEEWQSRLHPLDRAATLAALEGFKNGDRPNYEIEFRMHHKDGSWRWIAARADIVRDDSGAALRMTGSHFDVTERVRDRDAIRAAKDSQSAIIDAAMDAIITVGMDERILIFSAAAERLFKVSAHEMIGQPIERLVPIRYRQKHHQYIRDFGTEATVARAMGKLSRLTALRQDGVEFPIEASISHISTNDGQLFTITIRDITEREIRESASALLEAQLRESQKMEAIGLLAGGVAHDFNNIIATILGNADLATEDSKDSPQVLISLEEIRKAGGRARALVQQILSFSRRQPTDLKPTNLAATIAESVRLLRAVIPARIVLEWSAAPDVPVVMADETQIQQVLINLATNSMHAMHSRPGQIKIRLDTIIPTAALLAQHLVIQPLAEHLQGSLVRLSVVDDGPGMEATTLARVFEPFFTTKPLGEGTGLGLSVVHGIMKAHSGAATIDSTPSVGTTATLYFPVAVIPLDGPHESPSAAHASEDAPIGPRKNILYIDDDYALVFLVKRMLERRGYSVAAHTSQREALAALRSDPRAFDIVITDFNMPGMSGLDIAREVHGIRSDLPVAIASGFLDEDLRANAGDAGVRELIFKASDLTEYCAQIQRSMLVMDGVHNS